MTELKICAFIQIYNELEKGNLKRCLDNCSLWADYIVIYDDGSTDGSYEFAKQYTPYIIRGEKNNIYQELAHKQQLLDYAKANIKDIDYFLWLDADECVDLKGSIGGLKELCKTGRDSFQFQQFSFWRGPWIREDGIWGKRWFVRLWKNSSELKFKVEEGVHLQLYPENLKDKLKSDIKIYDYGFRDMEYVYKKIGADKNLLNTGIYANNWILNEVNLWVRKVDWNDLPPKTDRLYETSEPQRNDLILGKK